MKDKISQLLSTHIENIITLADQYPAQIVEAGMQLATSLLADGKILLCAQGRAYANGVHFAASMLNYGEVERPALPVMMLGAHAFGLRPLTSAGYDDQLFSREIQAFGQAQDLLIVLGISGDAPALIQALHAAKEKSMDCVVVCGENGEKFKPHLGSKDKLICVPSQIPSRIVELQLLVLHGFCEVIESALFSQVTE